MLLEEFDPTETAVINPWNIIEPVDGMPKIVIACYAQATFLRMVEELDAVVIARTSSANGIKPVYHAVYQGMELALVMLDVGAPMSVCMLEDVYQMGVETVIVFGACGVLDRHIEDCSVIIPDVALRDEGTSYHYAPSSEEIRVNEKYLQEFQDLLAHLQVKYTVGKVWTTDGIYRETPEKVQHRKEQGCICVDMECAANAAVAQFRKKDVIQFFYAADNLDSEKWDARSLRNEDKLEEKDRIAAIALELARRIKG